MSSVGLLYQMGQYGWVAKDIGNNTGILHGPKAEVWRAWLTKHDTPVLPCGHLIADMYIAQTTDKGNILNTHPIHEEKV